MNRALWDYLRRGRRSVDGWLQRVDAEIIGTLLEYQRLKGMRGGLVEIGAHHGKSFIPLCLSMAEGEQALCIDIFEQQEWNLDRSGSGDLVRLRENLVRFGVLASRVAILASRSEQVTPQQITDIVGKVRFFSIDGGHWEAVVKNDLYLAEAVLASGGVIALDDYFRAEWPEVTSGLARWSAATTTDIVPFAAGSNKLFLCRAGYTEAYLGALETSFLRHFCSKQYRSGSTQLACFRVELSHPDEERFLSKIRYGLKMFWPDLFVALATWVPRLSRSR